MNIVSREDTGHFPLESGDGNVEDKDDCTRNDRKGSCTYYVITFGGPERPPHII